MTSVHSNEYQHDQRYPPAPAYSQPHARTHSHIQTQSNGKPMDHHSHHDYMAQSSVHLQGGYYPAEKVGRKYVDEEMGGMGGDDRVAGIVEDGDGEVDGDGIDDVAEEEGEGSQCTESGIRSEEGRSGESKTKKPRITLARGGACVACRNRKLKCTGEKPCKTCVKASIDCRYEEIQRRKPRAVLLEERVVELEAILLARGEALPPTQLSGLPQQSSPVKESGSFSYSSSSQSGATSHSSAPKQSPHEVENLPPPLSLHSHRDYYASINTHPSKTTLVQPNSQLELALITVILPHTPYLLIPLHPQRFLALLTLSVDDPGRPHPALLYILFSEAARAIEKGIPSPRLPAPPAGMPPSPFTSQLPPIDTTWILPHIQGMSLPFLERARIELDNGIRNVDRPFDLVRAAVGIARQLYSLGRFIEGWNIPVSRLLVSCGLHRQTGIIIPPDGPPINTPLEQQQPTPFMPKPYAPSYHYLHTHTPGGQVGVDLPILRMRPVIIPPPRDEIEYAERVMTFWAAKCQDWESGIGWGWTLSLADEECTTEWGWGWSGGAEVKLSNAVTGRYALRDLYDPASTAHSFPHPDSTYTLAIKSLGVFHRASHLFDRPEADHATLSTDGLTIQPPAHIPSFQAVQEVEQALRLLRARIPLPFQDHSTSINPPATSLYDGPNDPWWIMLHTNLYTAEMMMWKEMAHHQRGGYERAISCARALVEFVKPIKADHWIHVDMIVALNLSLAARFLKKESDRLSVSGQTQAAALAAEDADVLRRSLSEDFARWMEMARMHGIIVQRVRDGWPEKEGEYERV